MTTKLSATLDNKEVVYDSETIFVVQVSKNASSKSSYETRYVINGNLPRAVLYYNAINIGNGYRKRLLMRGASKPVLARHISF